MAHSNGCLQEALENVIDDLSIKRQATEAIGSRIDVDLGGTVFYIKAEQESVKNLAPLRCTDL